LPCVLVGAWMWTREEAPPQAEALPTPKVLVVATPAPLHPLLWPVYTASATSDVMSNVVLPMFDYRFSEGSGLEYRPLLAQAWDWSEDGRTLSLVLRTDITWGDGHPVTAHDVAYSWELLRDPAVDSRKRGMADQLPIDAASGWPQNPMAIADDILIFRFAEAGPRSSQLLTASASPTPRHALFGTPGEMLRQHAQATQPLASGAFRFATPATPESFVLETNPQGPPWMKPGLDRVEFRIIPDEYTRVAQYIQGQADLAIAVSPSEAAAAAAQRPGTKIVDRGRRSLEYLVFNPSVEVLSTPELREAFLAMLDVDALMNSLLNAYDAPHAQRARGMICPSLLSDDSLPPPPPQDLAKAHATLATLGWADSNGDGRLDKNGTNLKLRLLFKGGVQFRKDLAAQLQQQLIAAGVQLELHELNPTTYDEQLRVMSFDIALLGQNAGLAIMPTSLVGHADPSTNPTRFNDPVVAGLLQSGLHEPDPARAADIWLEFQRQYRAKAPVIPLWWRGEVALLAPGFHDEHIDMVSTLHDLHLWQAP